MTQSDFDYIVVGAGAAGGVLASRLTEDPAVSVLLLESGEKRRHPLLQIPIGEVLLMGDRRFDWCFSTEPDPTLCNRSLKIPRGRLLGGSNAINGMIFVRGQPEDYNEWACSGNPGWTWSEVLPYFTRIEDATSLGMPGRGARGPISIERPRERDTLCDAFLAAAVERGYPANPDYNSGIQDGFGYYQATQRAGLRSSVVGTYLAAAQGRTNLSIMTGAHVEAVELQGRRCVGVRFRAGGLSHSVRATREVILCAGAIQSPQILELSGIGAPEVLAKAGVPLRHALPGVGENFHDHFGVRLKYRVNAPITFNERSRGAALMREFLRYATTRRGLLSLPIALGFGFVRSTPDQLRPDIQFHFAPATFHQDSKRRLDDRPGMTLGMYPLRPRSRGSVHIRSRDYMAPPVIMTNFLQHPDDMATVLAGIRIGRELMGAKPMRRFVEEELTPGPALNSDEELLVHVAAHGDTSFHPVGTCRMGNDDVAMVVARLRVRGIEALRVIDASIMPSMVSGNTNAATLMIAEKGAAMLLADLAESIRKTSARRKWSHEHA